MSRIRAILLSVLAVFALSSSTLAVGLHVGIDGYGPYASSTAPGLPVNLPSPCDLMGGKRMMPAGPEVAQRRAVEVPRATEAQWQFGLTDTPMREGRHPAAELKPPRAA